MQPNDSRRKLLTVIAIVFGAMVIIALIIALVIQVTTKNEYGESIKIQNYNQKVKNISQQLRSATEANLYNTAEKNNSGGNDLKKINDARIRDDSNTQDYDKAADIYSGKFIVDIESIKQSYLIQYTYVKDEDSTEGLTTRVMVSCVEQKDIKFGSFKCGDVIQEQSSKNEDIIQYLPYSNFSFNIAADTTAGDDKLILLVELRIPEADLKGDLASKQSVVAMYKNEVAKWLESKNLTPSQYTYEYNYTDNGDIIIPDHDQHGHSDDE